jgi:hypothetical protein
MLFFPVMSQDNELGCGTVLVFTAVCLVMFWFLFHDSLDRTGFLSHTATVDLYMDGQWLENESRVCTGIESIKTESKALETTALRCPVTATSATPHTLSVKFWGRLSRPDAIHAHRFPTWRCTRNGDDFTCKAID